MEIIKNNIYLSNCDSTKKLSLDVLEKKVLIGLSFFEGIILSPNIIIDNEYFFKIFFNKDVIRYLKEEGSGKVKVRTFIKSFDDKKFSALNYFESLRDTFYFSTFNKLKKDLTKSELENIRKKLKEIDECIKILHFKNEYVSISENSLTNEIHKRIKRYSQEIFENEDEMEKFFLITKDFSSRSDWYIYSKKFFDMGKNKKFIFSIVDPSYYGLFVEHKEGIINDEIKYLEKLPNIVLKLNLKYKSYEDELEYIDFAFKMIKIILTHGSDLVLDEVGDFFKEKFSDKAINKIYEKNWFGFYDKFLNKMGIELK